MRALWIEDHALIGDSVEALLQVVIPEVSLDKALDIQTAERLARTIHYDLVLLDWWIGPDSGADAISRLRSVGCEAPFIVVTGDPSDLVQQRALTLGATQVISKTAKPQTLINAIRVMLEKEPTSQSNRSGPSKKKRSELQSRNKSRSVFSELTERQSEVLDHLSRGLSNKQIAKSLSIAPTTVRSHVRVILDVIGVHTRGEAAYKARVRGNGGN